MKIADKKQESISSPALKYMIASPPYHNVQELISAQSRESTRALKRHLCQRTYSAT